MSNKQKIVCVSKFKTSDKVLLKAELNNKLAKLICLAENKKA